ncbi:MAG: hypothetical protein ACJ72W_26405 [Actinoallomurus sp.]
MPAALSFGRSLRRWLASFDPGLARLRMAVAATVSMGVVMAVEYGFAHLVRPSRSALPLMISGGIAAMQVSAVLMQPSWRERLRVALWKPVLVGAGLTANVLIAAVAGRGWATAFFVVVTFAAVYVRRLGPPFAVLGLMGWTGYFFAAFAKPAVADLPFLLAAVVLSAACSFVLSLIVWPHRPHLALRHTLRAWAAQSDAVTRAAAKALGSPARRHRRRGARLLAQLWSKQARLTQTALVIEGWLVHAAPDRWDPMALRERVLEAHVAIDTIVEVVAVVAEPGETTPYARVLPEVREIVRDLGRDHDAAAAGARRLLARARDARTGEGATR